METKRALVNVLIVLCLALLARSEEEYQCVYTLYVKTGSINKAGTDATISVEFWDERGDGVRIRDIRDWGGLMGPRHNYFERDNVDIFSGLGPCVSGSVCGLKLISDGYGPNSNWFCDYVEITTTTGSGGRGGRNQCSHQRFSIDQWLSDNTPPYERTTVRNYCPYDRVESSPTKLIPTLKSVGSS